MAFWPNTKKDKFESINKINFLIFLDLVVKEYRLPFTELYCTKYQLPETEQNILTFKGEKTGIQKWISQFISTLNKETVKIPDKHS